LSLPFVIDASVIGNWCFEDERTAEVETLIFTLADSYAEAPSLLLFEVQNLLRKAERKGRLTMADSDRFWMRLGNFDIRLQMSPSMADPADLLADSRTYGLTPYDASYLRLAIATSLPLATLDRDLQAAAIRAGVPLLLPPTP